MTREEVVRKIDASRFWTDISSTITEDEKLMKSCDVGEYFTPRKWELNEDGEESVMELFVTKEYLYIFVAVLDYHTELKVPYSEIIVDVENDWGGFPDNVGLKSKNQLTDFFIKLRNAEEVDNEEEVKGISEDLTERLKALEHRVRELESKICVASE